MKSKNYIPNNIHDVASVKRLKHLPFELIKEDVPALLEWLQDTHWEVSQGIAEYLIPHIREITPDLLFILNSNDTTWKYFVINILIARSKVPLAPDLVKALKRIADSPSKYEAEDTVNDAAERIIKNKELCG